MQRELSFTVKKEDEGTAVRKMLKKNFGFSSRLLASLKAQKLVFLNDVPLEGYMDIREGDIITARFPDERSHFEPEDIPINVIYEDEDILLLNKQPGITVHPTKGHAVHTIANGLMRHMEKTKDHFKVRFVNRLDMDTSGILIVAKNAHAQDHLIHQMEAGSLVKEYLALVVGDLEEEDVEGIHGIKMLKDPFVPEPEGTSFLIDLPIGLPDPERPERAVMSEGKPSQTEVHVMEHFGEDYTLLGLKLLTGRTHQIRVHLSHIGFPVAWDPLYGSQNIDGADYDPAGDLAPDHQFLHAHRISFDHPVSGKALTFEASLPEDLDAVIKDLRWHDALAGALTGAIY